jgi:hypothetical protein
LGQIRANPSAQAGHQVHSYMQMKAAASGGVGAAHFSQAGFMARLMGAI